MLCPFNFVQFVMCMASQRKIILILSVTFCSQDLHSQLENSNLDPREIERAKKGQVSS